MAKNNLKKFISMDFGKSGIKIAVGSFHNEILEIDGLYIEPFEKETYLNGEILNQENFINSIKNALSKNNIKTKNLICTIDSSEVIRRDMIIPKVSDEDMDDIVKTEISQFLPIDIDNFIVQYKIIEDFLEKNVEKYKLSVALILKRNVETFFNLIKKAGLKPIKMDLHSSSLENLIKYIIHQNLDSTEYQKEKITNSIISIVEIGSSAVFINIFKGSQNLFNRYVKVPELKDSEGNDILLNNFKSIDEIDNMDIFNLINNVISEIDMVFKYFNSRDKLNQVSEIFLFGGIGNTEGLDKYMEDILNVPTNRIDSIKSVINLDDDNFNDIDISLYLNAIGGILRW